MRQTCAEYFVTVKRNSYDCMQKYLYTNFSVKDICNHSIEYITVFDIKCLRESLGYSRIMPSHDHICLQTFKNPHIIKYLLYTHALKICNNVNKGSQLSFSKFRV